MHRWRRLAAAALVGAATMMAPAAAATAAPTPGAATSLTTATGQRLESFPLPSTAGNVDLAVARINRVTELRANVLLPAGYDVDPSARWPVLFLLHGVDDDASTWTKHSAGDLLERAAGFPGIVVMPEGGRGWYTDAWVGGQRTGIKWERYELDEVLPAIESRYRIQPGREHHAIGGLSMGGYGAMLLAAELPSYFGTAISMSGLLDTEEPVAELTVPFFSKFSYAFLWGKYRGEYAQAHDPMRLLGNLAGTRLYVSTGNGLPDPSVRLTGPDLVLGAPSEAASYVDAVQFTRAARAAGDAVTYSHHAGLHAWPYWRHEITRVFAWGPFGATPGGEATHRRDFTYATMAPHGNAWGLGFTFATPPFKRMVLTRHGDTLSATGAGAVTITPGAADGDASGAGTEARCAFTAELPFTRTLPAGC